MESVHTVRFAREFTYDAWANRRMIAAMAERGGGSERARELMSHILGAQRIWLARLDGGPLPEDAFTPRPAAECGVIQQVLEAAWLARLAGMTDADHARVFDYRNLKGEPFSAAVSDILTHVLYHGVYHRGQLASTLRADGVPPPSTDLILFARDEGERG